MTLRGAAAMSIIILDFYGRRMNVTVVPDAFASSLEVTLLLRKFGEGFGGKLSYTLVSMQ